MHMVHAVLVFLMCFIESRIDVPCTLILVCMLPYTNLMNIQLQAGQQPWRKNKTVAACELEFVNVTIIVHMLYRELHGELTM